MKYGFRIALSARKAVSEGFFLFVPVLPCTDTPPPAPDVG
jgi:hypothetical protein